MPHFTTSEDYQQKYFWQANYSNGKVIRQTEVNFKDLDRDGLIKFSMIDPELDKYILSISLKPGMKLAYRSRTILQEMRNVVDRIHIISIAEQDSEFKDGFFVHEVLGYIEYAPFDGKSETMHRPNFNEIDSTIIV